MKNLKFPERAGSHTSKNKIKLSSGNIISKKKIQAEKSQPTPVCTVDLLIK
jgi:hypothetical protein